jgi:hypothetical protein
MVYKSKKINRRRYIKKQSRRRMYGGDGEDEYNLPPPPPPQEKEEIKVPPPTMRGNLEDAGNLVVSALTNVIAGEINTLAKGAGIDPNKPADETIKDVSSIIGNVVDALNTPEGEKLKKNLSELLKESLEILEPSIKEAMKIGEEGATELTKTLTSMIMLALNEFPPILAANEISKALTATAQAEKTVAELATTGAEATQNLLVQKEKAETLWGDFKILFNNVISRAIGAAQKQVDDYGQAVEKRSMSIPEVTNNVLQSGGGSLKKYQREAKMIGGRVFQSQSEFLSPYVNRSQILQQYGGNLHTKRQHRVRRRLTSRRR